MKVILVTHTGDDYESSAKTLAVASTVENAERLIGRIVKETGSVYGGSWHLYEVEVDKDISAAFSGTVGKSLDAQPVVTVTMVEKK